MEKMVIREWAEADRPREKLIKQGRRAVTDAELLAILIGSGSKHETAVELCKRLLASVQQNLLSLSKLEVSELCKFRGIGEAKAISIIAAMELGRRRQELPSKDFELLNSSASVYQFFKDRLQDLSHEEFWSIYCNRAGRYIESHLIGRGGHDFTPVDIRIVLRHGLINKASSIILAHNHPSGTLKPSEADKSLTKKILNAAKIMDIQILDHLIFTDSGYFSFKDNDLM